MREPSAEDDAADEKSPEKRLAELRERLAEAEARRPAHSIPTRLEYEIQELRDEIDRVESLLSKRR